MTKLTPKQIIKESNSINFMDRLKIKRALHRIKKLIITEANDGYTTLYYCKPDYLSVKLLKVIKHRLQKQGFHVEIKSSSNFLSDDNIMNYTLSISWKSEF